MGRMASSSDAREKECFSDDFAERPILVLLVPILVLLSASATTCPRGLGSSSRSTRSRGAPAQRARVRLPRLGRRLAERAPPTTRFGLARGTPGATNQQLIDRVARRARRVSS